MMSELRLAIHTRKFVRISVTKVFTRREGFPSLSAVERSALEKKLSSQLEELRVVDSKIQSLAYCGEDLAGLDEELVTCEEYQDKIRSCLALLSGEAASNPVSPIIAQPLSTSSRSSNPLDAARSLLKSPIAPLPKYSGLETEDLTRFLSQFEDTISKYNYPSYDKFLLLKQQISGRALILVESLEITNQTYDEAVKLLKLALDCPITKKFNIIEQLTKLDLKSYNDPFEFISKFRRVSEVVNLLSIDCESFLQYFFWSG